MSTDTTSTDTTSTDTTKINLVMTVIGPDRPGLVEALSEAVVGRGGDWLESRMARLGGQFAGVLMTTVPAERVDDVLASLRSLEDNGLRVEVRRTAAEPASTEVRGVDLNVYGPDQPGIVNELARTLSRHGVNVEELETGRVSAPMTGQLIFRAWARLSVPSGVSDEALHLALDSVAAETQVDISVTAVVETEPGAS